MPQLVTSYNPAGAPAPLFDVFVAGTAADAFVCQFYVWSAGAWGGCSADCGAGVQARAVVCVDASGSSVDPSLCPQASIPAATAPCDQGSCEWVPTAWSDCTAACGGGTQLRNLQCRNGGGTGSRVIAGNCYSGAQPQTSQLCNTAPCQPLFWSPGQWSACSVQCGGGTSSRTVGCSAFSGGSTTPVAAEYCQVLGPMPLTVQACNPSPCAETSYALALFDSRVLASGAPRTDHYAPGETRFFTFERPNAGAQGLCIVATPSVALTPACTVQAERAVASCLNSLQGCVASANAAEALAAAARGTTSPARKPIDLWTWYGAPYATANGTCACFAQAATCMAKMVCSADVAASQRQLAAVCGLSSACPATGACVIPSPAPAAAASPASAAKLAILVSRYNTAALGANPFPLPTSAALADWASAGLAPGEQRLVVWAADDGYDAAASTVLVGVQSVARDVNVALTVTALSAFPVSYGGTLVAGGGGATAAAVRAGGLTLVVSLSCDAFVDPGPACVKASRCLLRRRRWYHTARSACMQHPLHPLRERAPEQPDDR